MDGKKRLVMLVNFSQLMNAHSVAHAQRDVDLWRCLGAKKAALS
jgi:hypothetical protein